MAKYFQKKRTTGLIIIFLAGLLSIAIIQAREALAVDAESSTAICVNCIKTQDDAAIKKEQKIIEEQKKAAEAKKAADKELQTNDNFLQKIWKNTISKVFGQVLKSALNTLATDSAKYIASGGKGQGTMFEKGGFGSYLKNVADATAGQFIESVTKGLVSDSPYGVIANFSFCNPGNINVAVTIGLGLRSSTGNTSLPTCTFSRIRKNVESFATDTNLMKTFQDMFQPTSNDLGLALTLQGKTMELPILAANNAASDRKENEGWLRVPNTLGSNVGNWLGQNLTGSNLQSTKANDEEYAKLVREKRDAQQLEANNDAITDLFNKAEDQNLADYESDKIDYDKYSANYDRYNEITDDQYSDVPKSSEQINSRVWDNLNNRMLSTVGDALTDAANVFLNQLALNAYTNLMKKITSTSNSDSDFAYSDTFWEAIVNSDAAPYNPGVKGALAKAQQLKTAQFSVRADFDILSVLSVCTDPQKAGPTDCVIDDKFRQAIQDRKTVGEAVADGSLPGDRIFGFQNVDAEPKYNEGYPYRSMLILRKYRILPAGWEVAAQYIHDHFTDSDVSGPVTLEKVMDCFSPNDEHNNTGYNKPWCQGLVDPNWLLKSPLNYCGKLGIGPTITSKNVGANGEVTVSRADNYCADDQSCIKEKDDGSCELYGYCAEDRRVWNYGSKAKSCEPVNNTCQTFKNAETQATANFLQNTLDFANCDASVVGCKAYCTTADTANYTYDYNTQKLSYKCQADSLPPDRIFFDRDAKACADKDEGCHQFIRTKEGVGANLLINSSLEDGGDVNTASSSLVDGYSTIASGLVTDDGYMGSSSLLLKADAPNIATATVPIGMQIFGWSFTFSFYSKGCSEQDTVAFDGYDTKVATFATSADQWVYNQTSANIDYYSTDDALRILFKIKSPSCKIDALKLERGGAATGYSLYGSNALIYEKLLPKYLEDTNACDVAGSSTLCSKYVRKCSKDEVGCDMYTSQSDATQIPGRVKSGDYCSAECVGFNDYMQTETVFDERGLQFFIPRTATKCKAEVAGCDEFTNVDKVGQGGETTEYYTYLRQCVKPSSSEAAGRCTPFYTWQSAGGQDFQLSVVNLFAKPALDEPDTTADDSKACTEVIYNLAPSDPKYNPSCQQYYDKNGKVSYHMVDKTISCDDNCHPYRLTRVNSSQTINAQADCESKVNKFGQRSAFWDSGKAKCMICSNNGEMVSAANATAEHYCVYQAIPDQGIKCTAAANGCREYVGSKGENVAQIMFSDFEDASLDSWQAIGATNIAQTTSLRKNGSALQVNGGEYAVGKKVGSLIKPGKTYAVSFLAQNDNPGKFIKIYANKTVALMAPDSVIDVVASNLSVGAWQLYTLNFTASSTYEPTGDEALIFDGDADFNIDEVKIKEITDRYYFIKESWKTPDGCYYNLEGNSPPPDINSLNLPYQLHCDHYKNPEGASYYLRSFDTLCRESAVGCELMIDTFNSKEYGGSANNSQLINDNFDTGLNAWQAPAGSTVDLDGGAIKLGGQRIVVRPINSVLKNGRTYALNLKTKGSNYISIRVIADPLNADGTVKDLVDESVVPRIDKVNEQNQLSSEWSSSNYVFTTSNTYSYTGNEYLLIKITSSALATPPWSVDISQPGYGPVYVDNVRLVEASAQGVKTPADQYAYVVYDKAKLCNASQKGCERMGKQTIYSNTAKSGTADIDNSKIRHDDVYLLNDPDSYDKILCNKNNLNCQAWKNDQSEVFFIDPQDNVCEYRQKKGSTDIAWLKRKMKYCGGSASVSGALCTTNDDCAGQTVEANKECKEEADDQPCPVNGAGTDIKTFGQGSAQIAQPIKDSLNHNWVGVCSEDQSGCTEYIDSVSKPSPNLLFNPTLDDLDDNGSFADGWSKIGDNKSLFKQDIVLNPYTVYSLGFSLSAARNVSATVSCQDSSGAFLLSSLTNKLVSSPIAIEQNDKGEKHINFRTDNATACRIEISTTGNNFEENAFGGDVVLRKTIIDYKIAKTLDKTSCNGEVDYGKGCVLFNERKVADVQDGGELKYAGNVFDADINYSNPNDKKAQAATSTEDNDSNTVLKVEPDRKCNKWLTCSSKVNYTDNYGVEKSYCSGVSMCDLLKSDGACEHVTKVDASKQVYNLGSGQKFLNYTGYSKVGLEDSPDIQMNGFYSIDKMGQIGDSIKIPNGDFEISTAEAEGQGAGRADNTVYRPTGWQVYDSSVTWNSSYFVVVKDAVTAQTEGVRYPISGRAILRVGTEESVKSDMIHLVNGAEYRLIYMVNTKNLSNGEVKVSIEDRDDATIKEFTTQAGKDWQPGMIKFVAAKVPVHIKISSTDAAGKIGRYYLDNFQIKPTLKVTKKGTSDYDRAPECRLYAADDALACEYTEDSGLKAKGLYGYCLEYDRAPGNPDTCLLWWPGDRIIGDGVADEGIGYNGPGPLYYCPEAEALIPVKLMKDKVELGSGKYAVLNLSIIAAAIGGIDPFAGTLLAGLGTDEFKGCKITNSLSDEYACLTQITAQGDDCCGGAPPLTPCVPYSYANYTSYCLPKPTKIYTDSDASHAGYSWYEFNGIWNGVDASMAVYNYPTEDATACFDKDVKCSNKTVTVHNHDIKFFDPHTNQLYDDRMAYCNKIARTVTESGENKYWSGRVYPNSKYKVGDAVGSNLKYIYSTILNPYASVVAPSGLDPYTWSGEENQTVPVETKTFADKADRQTFVNSMPYALLPSASSTVVNPYLGYCVDQVDQTTGSFDACVMTEAGYSLATVPNTSVRCKGTEVCVGFPNNDPAIAKAELRQLFAASYGSWHWDWATNRYTQDTDSSGYLWTAPDASCGTGIDTEPKDSCGVNPLVYNVSVSGKCADTSTYLTPNNCPTTDLLIHGPGFATINFNTKVNLEQRPLSSIEVDWRNGESNLTAGIQLTDRSDPGNTHSLSRLFSYWNLKAKKDVAGTEITCPTDPDDRCGIDAGGAKINYCHIKPRVKIRDNWGFCNCTSGTAANTGNCGNSCNEASYVNALQDVVVCEK